MPARQGRRRVAEMDRKVPSRARTSDHAHNPMHAALGEHGIGREARAQSSDHSAIKLWLRLLSCSTQIEQAIRKRLHRHFDTTLPRFDYLAQLARHPQGLRMNALSRYLMVSGGNVTALTDQLERAGHVSRSEAPDDRRSSIVKLTPAGRKHFARIARLHESWVVELLSGLDHDEKHAMHGQLGKLRVHLASTDTRATTTDTAKRASAQATVDDRSSARVTAAARSNTKATTVGRSTTRVSTAARAHDARRAAHARSSSTRTPR
jgi:DNA-binding MarR family transcriptional regulator